MNRVIKWIDAFVVALSVTAVMLIFVVITASAHAYLAESVPMNGALLDESPLEVTAKFSQEVESDGSFLRVMDDNGRQVDNGDSGLDLFDVDHKSMIVTLPNQLPDGQYTVEWVVISAEDGDPTDGAFTFGIGTDSLAPLADDTALADDSSTNANSNDFAAFTSSSDSVGWWVGGGIAALILGLLIAMLLLTRQPTIELE